MLEYFDWTNNPDYRIHLWMPEITTDEKIKKSQEKRLKSRMDRKRKNRKKRKPLK